MPFSIFLFILLINPALPLENPCASMIPRGYEEDWGLGVYFLDDDFEAFVYSDTLGTVVGRIEVADSYGRFYDIFRRRVPIEFGDKEWIGNYSCELLKVRKCNSTRYVQCLWKTGSNLYLDTTEIVSRYKLLSYRDLLFNKVLRKEILGYDSEVNVGINLVKSCLNLRTSPSVDSAKIACIPAELNQPTEDVRIKILKQSNDWAYVLVEAYVFQDGDVDCPSKLAISMKGWVKAIADNGFPNLWYAVSSY